ncbi:hypothetical protein Tco_0808736 [Tanacetum coccineum]
MGIRHVEGPTPSDGRSSMKQGKGLAKSKPMFSLSAKAFPPRLFKTWQPSNRYKISSISLKPDRAHIFTISGTIHFSTSPQIPNNTTSERSPMVTTVFAATTPENMPFAYHASTSTNPNPMIKPAFVKANYEVLEFLLRERRRLIRNEDLRTELEYFSEDYDEE